MNRGRVESVKGVNREWVLIPKPESNPEHLKCVQWLTFTKATKVERRTGNECEEQKGGYPARFAVFVPASSGRGIALRHWEGRATQ